MAGKTPFLNKSTALDAYQESKKWLRPYFDPIEEFDRIARNRPSPRIPTELPKVTDGTMSAIVQETPKRIVQQVSTGKVECKAYPEYAKIADIVHRDELIPSARQNGSYLQKSWVMLSKALTHGRSTSYTFYTETNGRFYTDFVIPYVKNIITEKGKVFAPDCNFRFLEAWYQRTDLKAIISTEKARQAKDKHYKSDWNLQALSDLIEAGASAKPADEQTPAEVEKGGDAGGYKIIHCFQTGKNAESYSIDTKGNILRTKVSKDPRGQMPFDDLYCNIDLSNPVGVGVVERSGGVQNLMDQQLQMFSFDTVMGMAPPIKKWGNVNMATVKHLPNAVWDMGGNKASGNDVEPYTSANPFTANFVNNFQLLQSKIYNLNNSQDTSIGAASGNAGQSKTQAGVNAQMERLGVSDNYLRKQYEDWQGAQSETALNIFFSEMTGTKDIALSKDDLREFEGTKAVKFIKDNKLTIPYKQINDVVFHFNVNPGTSEVKENAENLEKLIQTFELAGKTPNEAVQAKIPDLFKIIVKEIGAEGVAELFPEDKTDETGQPVAQQQPQITPEQIQQLVVQTVQQALEAQKAEQKPQEAPELQLIKALGVKWDKLPENTRNVILEQLGLPSDGDDPIAFDQNMAAFNALGTAESQQQQAETAQLQAQNPAANQEGAQAPIGQQPQEDQLAPEEQEFTEVMIQRGFDDDSIAQGLVMLRQRMPLEQIISTLARKQGMIGAVA